MSNLPALRARIGGLACRAQHDPLEYTKAARYAFMTRFMDEVDPKRELPEEEGARRAEAARRLYFAKLALKSAKARAKRSRKTE